MAAAKKKGGVGDIKDWRSYQSKEMSTKKKFPPKNAKIFII